MVSRLPSFSLDAYRTLLRDLRACAYEFRPCDRIVVDAAGMMDRVAYLRHDVDFHLANVDRVAEVEAAEGATATYFVLLSGHYNPWHPTNRATIRRLAALGHEVGLHYDMTTYPQDAAGARAQLQREVDLLSELVARPVRSIVMHQPFAGTPDPFRSLSDLVHPHDPRAQDGMLYVSDSCRAWRDESLLSCFGDSAPRRLLLNTHPELWLDGSVEHRLDYLERVIGPNAAGPFARYLDDEVREIWTTHAGPVAHDARERARRETAHRE